MTTDSQLRANQRNAQKSTGPRTEEGKAKARYNARRHGLTGQFYVMDDEDSQAYFVFETGLLSAMKPDGPLENQLAVSIAQDHWRINRAKGIEFNTFGLGHAESAATIHADSAATETAISQARAWRSGDKHFANMALYELRLHRIIAKNKKGTPRRTGQTPGRRSPGPRRSRTLPRQRTPKANCRTAPVRKRPGGIFPRRKNQNRGKRLRFFPRHPLRTNGLETNPRRSPFLQGQQLGSHQTPSVYASRLPQSGVKHA